MVLAAFGIGQAGYADSLVLQACREKKSLDSFFKEHKIVQIETKDLLKESYGVTSVFLTLTRSVFYTAHNFFKELPEKMQVGLELTKTFVVITVPLMLYKISDDMSKPMSAYEMVIHLVNDFSNMVESTGMVLEAIYAAGKYKGTIVTVADKMG